MMKKIWNSLVKDFWLVLLDIVSVNAAYLLALMVRFYINHHFMDWSKYLVDDFITFAPFYTVLCIIVFACFRLYGGLWKYAGLNDLNRIIKACAVTCVIQVIGTALFIRRMPLTYYFIGAVLQFVFLVATRFAYRVVQTESARIRNRKRKINIPAMVIGSGEKAKKVIRRIEESVYQVIVVVDEKNAGKTMDGIPIVADYDGEVDNIRAVFLADPDWDQEKRDELQRVVDAKGLDLQDYTGFFSNLSGRIPLTPLLELTKGPVKVKLENEEQEYENGEKALQHLKERYEVAQVDHLSLRLARPVESPYAGFESWAKQHKEETGEDISFF